MKNKILKIEGKEKSKRILLFLIFKILNRLQEDAKNLNRKLERMRKLEMASNKDEVLLEEIREYKEILRCPACKNKQRDAILSKCFHVFCYDCLKSRYDSRQRKCPKCNTAFGQSDMHKIWLV